MAAECAGCSGCQPRREGGYRRFFKVGNMGNSEFWGGGRGWLFLSEEGVWSVVALCAGFEAVS